jgi:hypothetical protein
MNLYKFGQFTLGSFVVFYQVGIASILNIAIIMAELSAGISLGYGADLEDFDFDRDDALPSKLGDSLSK